MSATPTVGSMWLGRPGIVRSFCAAIVYGLAMYSFGVGWANVGPGTRYDVGACLVLALGGAWLARERVRARRLAPEQAARPSWSWIHDEGITWPLAAACLAVAHHGWANFAFSHDGSIRSVARGMSAAAEYVALTLLVLPGLGSLRESGHALRRRETLRVLSWLGLGLLRGAIGAFVLIATLGAIYAP